MIRDSPRTKTCFVFMLTSWRPFDGVQAICFVRFRCLVGSEHQTLQATPTKVVLLFFNALTSRIGGIPKNLLYSRLNWLMLS